MAALSTEDRRRVCAHVMRNWDSGSIPVNKAELLDAIWKTDDWIEANQAAFNAALPLPFRTAATTAQKTILFCYVAMRRKGILHTEEDG